LLSDAPAQITVYSLPVSRRTMGSFRKIASKCDQDFRFYSYRLTNNNGRHLALRGLRLRAFAEAYSGATAVFVDKLDGQL